MSIYSFFLCQKLKLKQEKFINDVLLSFNKMYFFYFKLFFVTMINSSKWLLTTFKNFIWKSIHSLSFFFFLPDRSMAIHIFNSLWKHNLVISLRQTLCCLSLYRTGLSVIFLPIFFFLTHMGCRSYTKPNVLGSVLQLI